MDIAGAGAGLVALSPVLGAVWLAVRVRMGRPVFFVQERPGLAGETFALHKFRTMTDATDDHGELLPDSVRLTRLGTFLRHTSLDEFPQLFDVLAGHMSLVGPRPLITAYLDRYSPEQARRHEARPGITGWAQVNGRNTTSWPVRLAMDVWYVDHWSLALDVRILLRTLVQVLKRQGITSPGEATMPPFLGTEAS